MSSGYIPLGGSGKTISTWYFILLVEEDPQEVNIMLVIRNSMLKIFLIKKKFISTNESANIIQEVIIWIRIS